MNPFKLINLHGIIFSDEEKNLIDLEIQKMFQKGAIRRTSFDPRQFICLPFGLSSAPKVFTKVLKLFVVSIRNKGIRLVINLDDRAIISSSSELSSQEAAIVVQILESLGFIINKEKSVLIPSQKIIFLGYVIDSVATTISLPDEKLNKLKSKHCLCWGNRNVLFAN